MVYLFYFGFPSTQPSSAAQLAWHLLSPSALTWATATRPLLSSSARPAQRSKRAHSRTSSLSCGPHRRHSLLPPPALLAIVVASHALNPPHSNPPTTSRPPRALSLSALSARTTVGDKGTMGPRVSRPDNGIDGPLAARCSQPPSMMPNSVH